MNTSEGIYQLLTNFAEAVRTATQATASGDPESQLRSPAQRLLESVGQLMARPLTIVAETSLRGLGQPDLCVEDRGVWVGYVELKAPGKGGDPEQYRSTHDRRQWLRFRQLPNLIYTDGSEFALYRTGTRVGQLLRFSGRVDQTGRRAVSRQDAEQFQQLMAAFLSWEPAALPNNPNARDIADLLAPLCRLLRDEVEEAVGRPDSALAQVAAEWRELLFPEADNHRFADAYAQTVTFAFLLAKAEGASVNDITAAIPALAARHALLSRALEVLTVDTARQETQMSLRVLQRVVDLLPIEALGRSSGQDDPLLYFYEHFLAAYDPELRRNAGVYYTPPQVVHAQIRLVERLLIDRLGLPLGFANPAVTSLDPAVGTGTYLLGVIERARSTVLEREGPGAIGSRLSELASHLYGFEYMVGPYAVAQLRVSRALSTSGATLPQDGPGIYLTDTLESPYVEPQRVMSWYRVLARDHERALRVKRDVPVLVCLGNPPYDRHEAASEENVSRTGGWVRYGDELQTSSGHGLAWATIRARREEKSILYQGFTRGAIDAGHGGDVKNLYNLYVYFWRWALWKVFENGSGGGPGIVSFITASSYIDGDAFVGMREHMRRVCDEIWIIDLGGEGRGTRQEENVFAIRTPVAIAVCARYGVPSLETPAAVQYSRIVGDRTAKLARLDTVADFPDLPWEDCPTEWLAPFRPAGTGPYFKWPLLTDLMPWQHSGIKVGRTWPIAQDEEVLRRRWRRLMYEEPNERNTLLKDSPTGQQAHRPTNALPPQNHRLAAIKTLARDSECPDLISIAYRSFDRQYLIADGRLIDRPGPGMWRSYSNRQVFFVSLLTKSVGAGPALTACAVIPDLDYFSGRGAKDVIPLYRDAACESVNIASGLLKLLSETFSRRITPEDFVAYVYAVLAHPGFTERFWIQLESRQLRVPLTKDPTLFSEAVKIGQRLLWLHTFGERFTSRERPRLGIPRGRARCTLAVPGVSDRYPQDFSWQEGSDGDGTLYVGEGSFAPVAREIYEFQVSGLKVVQSWLNYRMRRPRNVRRSSPLDDIRPERWTAEFTGELLNVLWILEATIAIYPAQRKLLERIVEGM